MRFSALSVLSALGTIGLASTLAACSASDGAAGAQGEPGAAGPAGPAGATGAAGAQGPQGPGGAASDGGSAAAPSAVYTLSNDSTSNAIYVYDRAADGTLTPRDAYATGGRGTGAGLGDQGALAWSPSKKLFFAVNAGDSSISMLALRSDGSLSLISKIASGGVDPVSVTVNGDYVYAVNTGDATHPANVSGFQIAEAGLLPVEGSTQALSAASPGPAQISFTPDGKLLVVTEKGTNQIDTFVVTGGVAGTAHVHASAGMTPFGFAFGAGGQLIVSEAFAGADAASATSSYSLSPTDGALTPVSSSVASGQSAACWVAVAGTHAYVANAKSDNVTSYGVGANGALTLVGNGANGATAGGPVDMAVTSGGDFLYVLDGKAHAISAFAVGADGALAKKPDLTGVPATAVGLVAR